MLLEICHMYTYHSELFTSCLTLRALYECRISFADPVAVRHALAIISDVATRDPYSVAMALGPF